jgi:hypothetical protein
LRPDLSIVKNPEAFFCDLIDTAAKNQRTLLSDHAKIYLINLLSENALANNLIKKVDTPLSIIFQQSQTEPLKQRRAMLKYVGDYSLYVAGYFSESLNRKIIDVGYYISIGGQAFGVLSNIANSNETSSMYFEMFKKFSSLVDILTEISLETSVTKAEDIIRMYDRWLHTGSYVLEKKLMEKGIITSDKKLKTA